MRLAVVRRRFDPCGGAELYLARLLGALRELGWSPEVITESWSESAGLRVHPVEVRGGRAASFVGFSAGAEEVIKREGFDGVLSLERGVRADVYRAGDGLHAEWLGNLRRWGRWWKRPFVGWGAFHRAMCTADLRSLDPAVTKRVIVNSEMVRREIHQHASFPDERIHLVRNGLEVDRFRGGDRRRFREQWGVSEGQCVLLFAGSGWERKGLRWLRRSLVDLPAGQFRLVVAGRGRVPSGVGDDELYVGALRRDDMPDAYAAADMMVFPTLYDPSANACAEALAAGLPVITTRQNGAAEWVEEGVNGSIVESPAETRALVAAIRRWGDRRGVRSVPVSGDLSLERNARETVEVLKLALGG